jgi:peptide-methionine (S)-S-oxide reductase
MRAGERLLLEETLVSTSPNAAASLDAAFREAVAAIDAGDVGELERLIATTPTLVRDRLTLPGAWLRDKVGNALDGFFQRPYLLWFVAEDPVRNGTLPSNIAAVARAIIHAARRESAANLQEQLDHALTLVSWSWIARQHGVQLDLIDVLVNAGAALDGNQNNALVNGNVAAAEHLVKRGAALTLEVALCLGWWNDVDRLLPAASDREKQFAFVLSALSGKADALRRLIPTGVDVNAPSAGLYSHGTPLHHAVSSGSLEAVQVLVEAGADVNATDTAWGGTPLGWAQHYLGEGQAADADKQYADIAAYLRARSG